MRMRGKPEVVRDILQGMTRPERALALVAAAEELGRRIQAALAGLTPKEQKYARRLLFRGYRVHKAVWAARHKMK